MCVKRAEAAEFLVSNLIVFMLFLDFSAFRYIFSIYQASLKT